MCSYQSGISCDLPFGVMELLQKIAIYVMSPIFQAELGRCVHFVRSWYGFFIACVCVCLQVLWQVMSVQCAFELMQLSKSGKNCPWFFRDFASIMRSLALTLEQFGTNSQNEPANQDHCSHETWNELTFCLKRKRSWIISATTKVEWKWRSRFSLVKRFNRFELRVILKMHDTWKLHVFDWYYWPYDPIFPPSTSWKSSDEATKKVLR